MRLIGTADPGFTIGFNNTFRYKGFDLNFNFYGSFDRRMMDPTRMAYGVNAWGMAQYGYNGLRSLDDRWLPDKPSTKIPVLSLPVRLMDTETGSMKMLGISAYKI